MSPVSRFVAEVNIEGSIYIFAGGASVLFALFFWLIIKYSFHKGMAFALCALGLLQVWRGYAIIAGFANLNNAVSAGTLSEINIQQAIGNSELIKHTGIIFFIIALIGFFSFKNPFLKFWKGLMLGIIILSAISVILELAYCNSLFTGLQHEG